MNIDHISETTWMSVVQGTRNIQFELLGLQLLMVNLRQRLRAKEISNSDCIQELKNFYNKYSRLPKAQNDFNKIANS